MRNIINREPSLTTRMYEWYCGPEGSESVDYIGRQEYLHDHLSLILRDCGFDGEVPNIVSNRTKSGSVVWDDDVYLEMERLESPAIRRFYQDSSRVKFCE